MIQVTCDSCWRILTNDGQPDEKFVTFTNHADSKPGMTVVFHICQKCMDNKTEFNVRIRNKWKKYDVGGPDATQA